MSDRVKQYQESYSALNQARQRATEVVAAVSSLTQTLRNWERIRITGAVLRDEITLNDNLPCVSSDDWPTFEAFRDAVSAYHEASRDAQNIWMNMTDAERTGLNPPPHGM